MAALSALPQEPGQPTDVDVRSSILCFCLNKGPETIQELRRMAGEWFAKGLTAFTAQRHQEAIAAFTKAMQLNPRDARAYINRGIIYAKTRHYRQARADFTKAIALDPQRADAYYAAGLVSVLLGDGQQAEQNFQVATQLGYEPAAGYLHPVDVRYESPIVTAAHTHPAPIVGGEGVYSQRTQAGSDTRAHGWVRVRRQVCEQREPPISEPRCSFQWIIH